MLDQPGYNSLEAFRGCPLLDDDTDAQPDVDLRFCICHQLDHVFQRLGIAVDQPVGKLDIAFGKHFFQVAVDALEAGSPFQPVDDLLPVTGARQLEGPDLQPGHAAHTELPRQLRLFLDVDDTQFCYQAGLHQLGQDLHHRPTEGAMLPHEHDYTG